jgi:hypothetical protein
VESVARVVRYEMITPLLAVKLTTIVVKQKGTDCIVSSKSNYHTITTTAPTANQILFGGFY